MTTEEMKNEVTRYMFIPVNQWPETLKATVKNVGEKFGHSGDVFAETIEGWLKMGGKKELTADEVIEVLQS